MARPRIEVDDDEWAKISKLAQIFCTGAEICNILNYDYQTLDRRCLERWQMRFAKYIKKHADNGRASLRRQQYQKAVEGSIPMLIWLGKQELGQKDKNELSGEVELRTVTQMLEDSDTKKLIDLNPEYQMLEAPDKDE